MRPEDRERVAEIRSLVSDPDTHIQESRLPTDVLALLRVIDDQERELVASRRNEDRLSDLLKDIGYLSNQAKEKA